MYFAHSRTHTPSTEHPCRLRLRFDPRIILYSATIPAGCACACSVSIYSFSFSDFFPQFSLSLAVSLLSNFFQQLLLSRFSLHAFSLRRAPSDVPPNESLNWNWFGDSTYFVEWVGEWVLLPHSLLLLQNGPVPSACAGIQRVSFGAVDYQCCQFSEFLTRSSVLWLTNLENAAIPILERPP